MFNYENKSKPWRSKKLSCFKNSSRFRHFSFKNTWSNDLIF